MDTRKGTDPDLEQVAGDHYKHMTVQPTEFITKNEMTFAEGSVVKYIARHKLKGGADDIRKAIHYCRLILKHVYGATEAPGPSLEGGLGGAE